MKEEQELKYKVLFFENWKKKSWFQNSHVNFLIVLG